MGQLEEKTRKSMAKSRLALVAPATVIGTVEPRSRPPKRARHADVRAREYLTAHQSRRGQSQRPSRRHHGAGRLPAWLASRRAGDVALGRHRLRPRANPCESSQERRAIRPPIERCRTTGAAPAQARPGVAITVRVYVRARRALHDGGVAQDGDAARRCGKAGFKAHPHMFRHACGFQLANQGTDTRTLQAYLGHRNIQHTVRYTELSPTRFKNLWRD